MGESSEDLDEDIPGILEVGETFYGIVKYLKCLIYRPIGGVVWVWVKGHF